MAPEQSVTKSTVISFFYNLVTIATSVIAGVANTPATVLGYAAFCISQVKYAYDNYKARKCNAALKATYDARERTLSSRNYGITLETATGFKDTLGLHDTLSSSISSSALVVGNLMLASAAMSTAVSANETGQTQQFDHLPVCKTALCFSSYALGAAAVALATTEQHYKSKNLKRIRLTLEDGINQLNSAISNQNVVQQPPLSQPQIRCTII